MSSKFIAKTSLALLIVVSAGACKIVKPYATPEVAEETKNNLYRQENSTDTTSFADISWKEVFTDPKLQSLINEGLENSYDLKIAMERIVEANATFRQSKQTGLPSFYFEPNVTFNQQSKAALNLPSNININLKTTTVQLPFGTSWEIDIWGKLASAKRSALAQMLQTQASARAIQTQLISSIATNYYRLLALDEQLAITQQTMELRKKDVEALAEMKEASLVNGAALAQNEANMYAAAVSIPDLKQNIRETENALCVLIGRTPGEIERTSFYEQQIYTDFHAGVPMLLLKNRPDVAAAEYAFMSAFEQTNVARASFYPTLSLNGKAGISALTRNSLFVNSFFTNLAGNLLQPIYNKGTNKANLRRATSKQQQALYSFQQTLLNAGSEVSNALYAYETSSERDSLRVKQVESLQRAVEYTRELLQYSSTTNYTDVITSEQALLNSQLSSVNDRLLKLLAIVNLYRSLGGGWK